MSVGAEPSKVEAYLFAKVISNVVYRLVLVPFGILSPIGVEFSSRIADVATATAALIVVVEWSVVKRKRVTKVAILQESIDAHLAFAHLTELGRLQHFVDGTLTLRGAYVGRIESAGNVLLHVGSPKQASKILGRFLLVCVVDDKLLKLKFSD